MIEFILHPEGTFYLLNLPLEIQSFYKPIFNMILNKTQSFFSITFTDKEVSLILSLEQFERYFKNYEIIYDNICVSEIYKGFLVTTKIPGLNEVGILSELSNLFSSYEIPILNLSTYLGNYIFYPEYDEDKFLRMIENNKNVKIYLQLEKEVF